MTAPSHLERTFRRVQHLLQIGKSSVAPSDGGNVQTMQVRVTSATTRDAVPVLYHYGFSASPPVGTDVAIVNVAGDNSNGLIVASGHQAYRLKGLPNGGVALYDMAGSSIVLDGAGNMTAAPAGGTLHVVGAIVSTGDIVANGISLERHVHSGIQRGASDTDPPVA